MRYFLTFSYHGGNYHGWQRQNNAISVQEKIEETLSVLLKEKAEIIAAGRTDAGVHAKMMVAHIDTACSFEVQKLIYQFNEIVPNDIVLNNIQQVESTMHARFNAKSRLYEYKIYLGYNPFTLDTSWQLHTKKLDVSAMNEAAKLLFEYTNFECFSKVKTDVKTFNCEMMKAQWNQEGNELVFSIKANRFLRNMVRAIVGTMVLVGTQKINLNEFRSIIESKNRSNAGPSAPAQGLFLINIEY